MLTKSLIGVALLLIAVIGLFINFLAVIATFHLAKKGTNNIYIIATTNIAVDTVCLLAVIFYQAPTIIADSYFFPGGKTDTLTIAVGTLFMFCWYATTITQPVVAINRLVVICFSKYTFCHSYSVYKLILLIIPVAFILAINSQYILPCCDIIMDHEYLSYSYLVKENIPNYSNEYVDLPLNTFSSVTTFACYTIILIYVRITHSRITVSNLSLQRKRKREIALAVQFVYISCFYMFSWVFFRVFPLFLNASSSRDWYSVIAFCAAICYSANGAVYLTCNVEVQKIVKKRISMRKLTRSVGSSDNARS